MFSKCSSLTYLPDISNFNTSKVECCNEIFAYCSSLKKILDISKWNTNNIIKMDRLFLDCSKIETLPDISNKISNFKEGVDFEKFELVFLKYFLNFGIYCFNFIIILNIK